MYGVLHKGLTAWLLSLDDTGELLQRVEDETEIDGTIDDFFRYYSVQQTQRFLKVAAKYTKLSVGECMANAGLHFLDGVLESGYGHMLKALGDTFFELLENLDSLHESFVASFPEMNVSSFRPRQGEDGTMIVSYFSEGTGFADFAMGALKACAQDMFNLEVDVRHVVKKGKGCNHDEFRVFVDKSAFPNANALSFGTEDYCTLSLNKELTNNLLPWHFAFNADLQLTSIGHELSARLSMDDPIGKSVSSLFTILRPVATKFEYEALSVLEETLGVTLIIKNEFLLARSNVSNLSSTLDTIHQSTSSLNQDGLSEGGLSHSASVMSFQSAVSDGNMKKNSELAKKKKHLKLHGQFTLAENGDVIFFGTPALRSYEEMVAQGVDLQQMPIHSHARDVLFGSLFLSTSAANSVLVDRKLADLDATMNEVEEKKNQIDGLLHSILPPVVANSLALGSIPPAERYENVTVLHSTVNNFSLITSEIPAAQVMGMLHELFVKFDDLTEKHGCYKVETNGDAYVVACGCPEEHPDHAERMAYLAIDMIQVAKEVINPLDGEPLHAIIGMHSGSLMAGVVGRARPRYCLFGDTVNLTEQLCQAGLPGAIQVSYRFVQALPEEHPLKIVARGHINLSGKKNVKCFLLLGSTYDEDIEAALPERTLMADIAPKLLDMTVSTSDREVEDRLATILASRGQRLAKKQLV
eukprot:m.8239 g.8239  ORF g.8239 m.8239 type:complete len:697 (+) comp3066_c0_seq1:69-2159(+)